MVALVEAQAGQIASLKAAVESLQARLALRGALDTVVLEQVREPVEDLLAGLRTLHEAPDQFLAEQTLARGEQLAAVLEQLLAPPEVAPVSLARNELQHVNLRELIGKALTLLRGAGTVAIDVPPGLSLITSPARLVAMVNALVDNALRHGGEPVDVWAQMTPDGDVEVHVADRGPGLNGLDPDEFFEGPLPTSEQATFGLYLVHRLVGSLGGDVALVDRPGGGAIATLRIPQRRTADPRD